MERGEIFLPLTCRLPSMGWRDQEVTGPSPAVAMENRPYRRPRSSPQTRWLLGSVRNFGCVAFDHRQCLAENFADPVDEACPEVHPESLRFDYPLRCLRWTGRQGTQCTGRKVWWPRYFLPNLRIKETLQWNVRLNRIGRRRYLKK